MKVTLDMPDAGYAVHLLGDWRRDRKVYSRRFGKEDRKVASEAVAIRSITVEPVTAAEDAALTAANLDSIKVSRAQRS
jgi:hypothetical protein